MDRALKEIYSRRCHNLIIEIGYEVPQFQNYRRVNFFKSFKSDYKELNSQFWSLHNTNIECDLWLRGGEAATEFLLSNGVHPEVVQEFKAFYNEETVKTLLPCRPNSVVHLESNDIEVIERVWNLLDALNWDDRYRAVFTSISDYIAVENFLKEKRCSNMFVQLDAMY